MLSPQSPTISYAYEDEHSEVRDPIVNHKDFRKLHKTFSYLGILHSKINFLFTCITLSLVPIGFKLKWTEQTGFFSQDLTDNVRECLHRTSMELQTTIFHASVAKFQSTLEIIFSQQMSTPPSQWSKGMTNYQFLFSVYSAKHQKKLSALSSSSVLKHCFPLLDLITKPQFSASNLPQTLVSNIQEGEENRSLLVSVQSSSNLSSPTKDSQEVQESRSVLVPVQLSSNLSSTSSDSQEGQSHTTVDSQEGQVSSYLSSPPSDSQEDQESGSVFVPVPTSDLLESQGDEVCNSTERSLLPSTSSLHISVTTNGRPMESNTFVFTPEMINPIPYEPSNFFPICIDDVEVPQSLLELAALSPSFSPTPTRFQPPDGNLLHEDLLEFKRVLSWTVRFNRQAFDNASSVEEFLNEQLSTFTKSPWYQKSSRTPPPLPAVLEQAFNTLYSSIMQPRTWFKYKPNLSADLRQAIALAKTLPANGIGIYCQDKSSRICFASLNKTNQKVEAVLSDNTKYKKLPSDQAVPYQAKIRTWYSASKKHLKSIPDDLSTFRKAILLFLHLR